MCRNTIAASFNTVKTFRLNKIEIKELFFNAVAPEPVTNKEMTYLLARLHNKKIRLPNIPPFLIKLLFGEASVLLLEGSRVSSQKIVDKGFRFKYEKLEGALKNLLIK